MNTSTRDVEKMLRENRNLRDSVRGYQQTANTIRALHHKVTDTHGGRPICWECLRDHPCPTVQALDG